MVDQVARTNTFDVWRTTLNETVVRWNNLGTYDAIVITGGTINGTIIGNSEAAAGTFTNLTASGSVNLASATLILADDQISGDKISGGTAQLAYCELSNAPSSDNHAVRKDYVDDIEESLTNDIITFAILFGG